MTDIAGSALVAVLEALPIAVVLVDGTRIVSWNEAAEILYGHGAAEVVGCSMLDVLFDPEDRASAAKTLGALADRQCWDGDCRVRRRDGVLLVSSFRAVHAGAGREGALVAWLAADRMDQGLAEQERAVLVSAEHGARQAAEEAPGPGRSGRGIGSCRHRGIRPRVALRAGQRRAGRDQRGSGGGPHRPLRG